MVLQDIWTRWNGIKHVWEASGWPFATDRELHDYLLTHPGKKVVLLIRRNLLRRLVSNYLSRETRFWIGSRAAFLARLHRLQLRELDPDAVRAQIQRDRAALEHCVELLSTSRVPLLTLFYEDIFDQAVADDQRLSRINELLVFLNATKVTMEAFNLHYKRHFDPSINRWASPEVYRRIPGIERIEQEVGSDDTGWLFKL